ncbi:MAG: hypothetical protein IKM07_01845 [Clostridia bacterium]|nr:hypothetical protein [Clostridia bacterium]
MFKLTETFREYDERKQSYAFDIEKNSDLAHLHAYTGADGFHVTCPGNKYLLKTPKVHDFTLKLSVSYTQLTNFDTNMRIVFGYDRRERTGYALELEWRLDGGVTLRMLRVEDVHPTVLYKLDIGNAPLREDESYPMEFDFREGYVRGQVSGLHFMMALPAYEKGLVGFWRAFFTQEGPVNVRSRGHFIGDWILSELLFETDEEMEEELVDPGSSVELPMLFGGSNPYTLSWRITRVDGQAYLGITLDGGTYRQEYDFPGEHGVESDRFRGAYIRAGAQKWKLCGEELTIINQQMVWKCLKTIWNASDLPIERSWQLDDENFTDIAFGFEHADYAGYHIQTGGPWEFAFDRAGMPVYSGAPAGEDWFELKSPADKRAVQMIPKETVRYEDVAAHFANNHYFAPDEPIKLSFVIHSEKKPLRVRAKLCDVYGAPIEDVPLDDDLSCTLAPRPVGLYRMIYEVSYGRRVLAAPEYVLEVFDPTGKTCAPLVSGLPFLFSTPNEQKGLDRDAFDPWNPQPSCNAEHFFACVCFTPVYARERRTWEITKLFGREWYVWVDHRVVPGSAPRCGNTRYPRWEDWTDIVDNCDYMDYPGPFEHCTVRNDLWRLATYQNGLSDVVADFMVDEPDVQLSWKPGERFEKPHLDELMTRYPARFVPYALVKIRQNIKEKLDFFRARNPRWKYAAYGPYATYVNALGTYYLGNLSGRLMDDGLARDMYTGFAQFEDYPFSCEYGTYRSALNMATIAQHCGGLKLYPEQYRSSEGGCIDGAVKYAHPPLGSYYMPDYYTVTQSWEGVCNTPRRTPDGYRWWDSYGFMKRDNTTSELEHYVQGWGQILRHLPGRPITRTYLITDFCSSDIRYDGDYIDAHDWPNIHHISEEGCTYLYEQSRLRGLPLPCIMTWETLAGVKADEADIIVVPSLVNAPDWAEEKLRALAGAGVALIALSDVGGLADLFGIRAENHKKRVCEVEYKGEREYITPFEAEFLAVPTDGEVVMTADGEPVIIRKGRCVYFNAPISEIGRQSFMERVAVCQGTVSRLLALATGALLCELSRPDAEAENAGLTLYEGRDGVKRALLISYALEDKPVTLRFRTSVADCSLAASCGVNDFNLLEEDGEMRAEFTLPFKGWALLTLKDCE